MNQVVGMNEHANLSNHPRSLILLWNEWEFGIGTNKPAREFTARERGRKPVKNKFCLRKVFWKKVEEMIRRGYTAETACLKIKHVYARYNSMTKLLYAMKADRNRGFPSELNDRPL